MTTTVTLPARSAYVDTDKTIAAQLVASMPDVVSPRQAGMISRQVDAARDAAISAIQALSEFLTETGPDADVNARLSALRSLADHAGYSNSALTYTAEVFAAAGRATGIVEAVFA